MTDNADKRRPWSKPWDFLKAYLRSNSEPLPDQAPAKPSYATVMNAIQSRLRPYLKANGFRGRGRNFNRTTIDGLVQVISFQMARFDPPGTVYIPGLTGDLYGQFTVNLGVFIPEVHEFHGYGDVGDIVPEVMCALRTRLGEIGPESADLWWPISDDETLNTELEDRLRNEALPFFAQFETRDKCLGLQDINRKLGFDPTPRLTSAIILNGRGEQEAARRLLCEQVREAELKGSKPHAQYVRELSLKLGLGPIEED